MARRGVVVDEVPFTADDLPGYAVGYFDQLVAEPESLRLLAMLLALTRSWLTATPPLRSLARGDPAGRARLTAHREALRTAVGRALDGAAAQAG